MILVDNILWNWEEETVLHVLERIRQLHFGTSLECEEIK